MKHVVKSYLVIIMTILFVIGTIDISQAYQSGLLLWPSIAITIITGLLTIILFNYHAEQ